MAQRPEQCLKVLVAAEIVRLQDNHEPAAAWDHQCTNELRAADAAIATAPTWWWPTSWALWWPAIWWWSDSTVSQVVLSQDNDATSCFGALRRSQRHVDCPGRGHRPAERGCWTVSLIPGAGRGTRTPTVSPPADFESAASTDSAIPARESSIIRHPPSSQQV